MSYKYDDSNSLFAKMYHTKSIWQNTISCNRIAVNMAAIFLPLLDVIYSRTSKVNYMNRCEESGQGWSWFVR